MSTMTEARPQWRIALDNGNRIRLARAAYKRDIAQRRAMKASWRACADIIMDPPEVLRAMKVRELICACRSLGDDKADEMLRRAGIGPTTLVGHPDDHGRGLLTTRQRQALAILLRHGSMHEAPDVSAIIRYRDSEFHPDDVVRDGVAR